MMLQYDKGIRVLGEMKPNEPMDCAYLPTTGHFLSLCYKTVDPSRVGVLIETAHALLAGLDPAMEMAFALYHGKLWGVHLNDQNGLKFDEDRVFGAVNLKRAFDQVFVLYENDFGAMNARRMLKPVRLCRGLLSPYTPTNQARFQPWIGFFYHPRRADARLRLRTRRGLLAALRARATCRCARLIHGIRDDT